MDTTALDKETACSERRGGREYGTRKDHSWLEYRVVGGKMAREENEKGKKVLINHARRLDFIPGVLGSI